VAKTLLLDADSFCYSLAAVHQTVFKWTEELYTYRGDLSGAKDAFKAFLEDAMKVTDCDSVRMALTCTKANFRKRILPSYKASRISKEKPILFKAMRDWLQQEYQADVVYGLEGDDLVSIWATGAEDDTVVCSIDKDCKTIPGWLYNPNRKSIEHYSSSTAEWFFLEQALMGDRVDGYPGCPGIGPKRAADIMSNSALSGQWEAIVEAYEKAGLSEAVALQNARCARLLRSGEAVADVGGMRIKLWHPRGDDEWLVVMD
jgi:DNA polymerase I